MNQFQSEVCPEYKNFGRPLTIEACFRARATCIANCWIFALIVAMPNPCRPLTSGLAGMRAGGRATGDPRSTGVQATSRPRSALWRASPHPCCQSESLLPPPPPIHIPAAPPRAGPRACGRGHRRPARPECRRRGDPRSAPASEPSSALPILIPVVTATPSLTEEGSGLPKLPGHQRYRAGRLRERMCGHLARSDSCQPSSTKPHPCSLCDRVSRSTGVRAHASRAASPLRPPRRV